MSRQDLDCEVVQTRGGAPAMLDRITGEVMHPVVGPMVEATSLYIEPSRLAARLRAPGPDPLVLLDVGLGAGSNAALAWTLSEALAPDARRLHIVSFDRSLAALRLASSREHAADFGLQGSAGVAAQALLAKGRHETGRTVWCARIGDARDLLALEHDATVDVVFWDPFSPRANPDLWSVAAFSAVRRICRTGATLHTYSRATATRSALLLGGFSVGFGVSSFGDRQTTIAALDVGDLTHPLDRRWLDRLTRSSAPFPPDAPDDALARIAALMQFGAATAAAAPGLPTVPNARCPASQPTESPQVP